MLNRDQDYMSVCNPSGKISEPSFEKSICAQCSRPECYRSSYHQDATNKRLEKAEKLTTFVDPKDDTVPVSPLSEYPDTVVHRADVPGIEEDPARIDEATQALSAVTSESSSPKTPPKEPESRPADPWEMPKGAPVNIHREYDDPKQDPWSAEYEGGREVKAEPGVTIVFSGKKR